MPDPVTLEYLGQEARRTQDRLRALERAQSDTQRTLITVIGVLQRVEQYMSTGLRDDLVLTIKLELSNAVARFDERIDRIEERLEGIDRG